MPNGINFRDRSDPLLIHGDQLSLMDPQNRLWIHNEWEPLISYIMTKRYISNCSVLAPMEAEVCSKSWEDRVTLVSDIMVTVLLRIRDYATFNKRNCLGAGSS